MKQTYSPKISLGKYQIESLLLNSIMLILLFCLISFSSYGQYNVSGGKVIIEIESQPLKSQWKKGTSGSVTYYEGTKDNFQKPLSGGIYSFNVKFDKAGVYRVNWRSKINIGSHSADFNDSWLKFPNNSNIMYFAYKGSASTESQLISNLNSRNNILFPVGSSFNTSATTGTNTGNNGYFKAFMNTVDKWHWDARTSDHDAHNLFVYVKNAGTYTMQISNRSRGHAIDKIGVWKVDTHGVNGGSITGDSGGGGGGGDDPTCSASLSSFASIDENDTPITLTGGSPSGGSYSGPSVSNGKFDPSIGPGTYNITYSVTDSKGCTATASRNITVTSNTGGDTGGDTGGTGSGPGVIVLVNTNTQNDIGNINNNDIIDLAKVGKNIGIRADFPDGVSTGVKFILTGPFSWTKSEGLSSPWSLFGDIGVNINPWPSANLKTGNYTLTVKGNGTTTTVNFQITEGSGDGGGTGGDTGTGGGSGTGISAVLVNTSNQNDVSTIKNGDVIDLSIVGTKIGIRAEIPGNTTGVKFTLTGPFNWSKSEGKSSPWSLFGDTGVNINPWPSANLKTGNYTLTIKGNGLIHTVSFQIISGDGGTGGGDGGNDGGTEADPGDGTGITAILVNTNTQNDVSAIKNGAIIDLSKVGSNIGIRASISGLNELTWGVKFTLTGPFNWSKTEGKISPFSLFGDVGVKINPWPSANLKTGNYTLTIKGNGLVHTVSFQVISGTTANARDISPDFAAPNYSLPQITSVYPNPVSDSRLNVSFSQPLNGEVTYTIYDPTGKSIQLEKIDANNTVLLQLRLSEAVSPGMYYLKLKSRTHQVVWHHRFIKTH